MRDVSKIEFELETVELLEAIFFQMEYFAKISNSSFLLGVPHTDNIDIFAKYCTKIRKELFLPKFQQDFTTVSSLNSIFETFLMTFPKEHQHKSTNPGETWPVESEFHIRFSLSSTSKDLDEVKLR